MLMIFWICKKQGHTRLVCQQKAVLATPYISSMTARTFTLIKFESCHLQSLNQFYGLSLLSTLLLSTIDVIITIATRKYHFKKTEHTNKYSARECSTNKVQTSSASSSFISSIITSTQVVTKP